MAAKKKEVAENAAEAERGYSAVGAGAEEANARAAAARANQTATAHKRVKPAAKHK